MGKRQEQEPARSEVSEVAPNVLRLELPIRLPGLGHVNCYAILDDDGAALVDPGLPGLPTWRVLQDRLKQAGLSVKHIHTVIVTHSHSDHFGGAVRLARDAKAEVVGHRSFRLERYYGNLGSSEVSVEDLEAQDDVEIADQQVDPAVLARLENEGITAWGGKADRAPLRTRLRWRLMDWLGTPIVPTITRPVEHGDVLKLAGREWFVVHTPGHTPDHVCLHDPERGILLAGDHVLPTITPHISGNGTSADPLASFFYSLDRVAEISGVETVLPAHGHPFDDLKGRAEAIKRHHKERLVRLQEISTELGPASVEEFSQKLFKPRSWGSMAESETYAHLEHLRFSREAERYEDSDGRLVYVTR